MVATLRNTAFGFYTYNANESPRETHLAVEPLRPNSDELEKLKVELQKSSRYRQLENQFTWALADSAQLHTGRSQQVPIPKDRAWRKGIRRRKKPRLDMQLGGFTPKKFAQMSDQLKLIGPIGDGTLLAQTMGFDRWEVRQCVINLNKPLPGEAYAFHALHRSVEDGGYLGSMHIVFLPGFHAAQP